LKINSDHNNFFSICKLYARYAICDFTFYLVSRFAWDCWLESCHLTLVSWLGTCI